MAGEENPVSLLKLVNRKPPLSAAGWPAINASLKHVLGAMPPLRAGQVLFKLNQKNGFDCPGCAWPDPEHRSGLGEYCENGAKAIAEEATTKKADAKFFAKHSLAEMGNWTDFEIGKSGRLTEPMYLAEGDTHYKPISWSDAFEKIGLNLNALEDPNQAIFYTSGRTSNEAAFLYQLFVRMYGTNNLPDCSNMCHESSGVALSKTVGIGKGSVRLEDFYEAELILVAGQNPGTNHPRMLSALEKAKDNGAKVITINPLQEAGLVRFKNPQRISGLLASGTALTDLFLQVRINGDVALAKAIAVGLLEAEAANPGVLDQDFIQQQTNGFAALKAHLEEQDFEQLCADAGVPAQDVKQAVEMMAKSQKIIICWAMGLTQHVNGVQNIQEYVNLLLMKGAIGKAGAGTCPVRGHSNVQGDRTVGIWEKPKAAFLDRLQARFNFSPPREHGHDTIHAIKAMREGKAKFFFAMGGNFLSATPDTLYTAEALRKCDLTVHVSTKLNRSHLVHGKEALILPCLGRTEVDLQEKGQQFVTVENSMGRVHRSKGVLAPISNQLLSEPAIVAGLAKETLSPDIDLDWDKLVENYDEIRELIEACIPGFDNYNERVRGENGFDLPNGARIGEFHTASGKAEFTVNPLPPTNLAEQEFMMMTVRSHDQFNTTIYGLDDRYRGIQGERRVALINPDDLRRSGFKTQEAVDLVSIYEGKERLAQNFQLIPYDIPPRCIATYFPEANVLVPIDEMAEESHTPVSKLVRIQLRAR